MLLARLLAITGAIFRLLLWHALQRIHPTAAAAEAPRRLCRTLETLGTTFIKFGQALSLRREVLPDAYVTALQNLQDHVAPFPGERAAAAVEQTLRHPVSVLFAEFDPQPFAAASIAQVHRARLPDGRAVVVKVRRTGIKAQIDRDMRILVWLARAALVVAPSLRQYQPLAIIDEIWTNLRKEIDFCQEARNIRRFMHAFAGSATVHIPALVDDLYGEAVLVQEMSGGLRIDDPAARKDGPRLAQALVEAYLHQFFVLGVFHGDPHPGNIFITPQGRICLHDFGIVGFLDRDTRRQLAAFTNAFIHQDAGWLLDAAIGLGLFGGDIDRAEFRRGLAEILADYASLPLKEWSLAEALLRVTRLGRRGDFLIPHNLLVLMRTLFQIEYAVRCLDADFMLLDTLIAKGSEAITNVMAPTEGAGARLREETALMVHDAPTMLALWLNRLQNWQGIEVRMRHEGLGAFTEHLDRTGNRIALAIVILGLYVAGSLLMLHGGGLVYSDTPLLAMLIYALAIWLTWRLARGISRSGRL